MALKEKKVHCCCNLRIAGAVIGTIRLAIIVYFVVLTCFNINRQKIENDSKKMDERSEIFTYVTKAFMSVDFVMNILLFFGLFYIRHLLILPLVFTNAILFGSALLIFPVAIYDQSTYKATSAVLQGVIFGYFLYVLFSCYQYVRDLRRSMDVITIELKEIQRPMVTFVSPQGITSKTLLDKSNEAENGLLPPSYEKCVQ